MTAAAEKLFLTQPAVSQQIRNLEEELAVELLVRGVRQVKPTLQGQLLFDYAKRILHLTNQAEVAIRTMSQEIIGDLRIGTINSIGLYLISPIVGMFLKHNSKMKLKLTYGSGERLIQEMRQAAIDMVILPDLKSEYGIEFQNYEKKFLFRDEIWLVGSGRNTSLPQSIELRDLPAQPMISFTEKYPGFRMMFDKKLAESKVKLDPVFETDNVGTLKKVIESGLGWGFLPSHSIRKQVRTGRLSLIQCDEVKYSVNVNLYFKKEMINEPIVDVFFRALHQQALNS
ncbi:MAG: LysR family transcriptional regulator [Bdellovibrionales bacterium]|nr:LysR family transcriptional regulator [Bdellovibrionales bacterium]